MKEQNNYTQDVISESYIFKTQTKINNKYKRSAKM